MTPVTAYVGLGSNLQNPVQQLHTALVMFQQIPRTRLLGCSGFYRSRPLGPPDQPDYVNAVAALETGLDPLELLAELQYIETSRGRVRDGIRWGPRILDLDILLYGDQSIAGPTLTVPHPGLPERGFVLYPLAEIAPGLEIPGYGPLAGLLARCDDANLERLTDS